MSITNDVTASDVRGFIVGRQRELMEKITEAREEAAAWNRIADKLQRELDCVSDGVVNEWLADAAKVAPDHGMADAEG